MPYLRGGILFGLLLSALVQAREPEKILILGDSISAAYGINIEQGWVHLWAQSLQDQVQIINASISGETTTGGLARLPALLEQHRPDSVVIELGGNDGLRGYPIPKLRSNLLGMIETSLAFGAEVAVVPMQIPPNYGEAYAKQFYDTFTQVAEATNVILTPFILEAVALDPELMQGDGIHPTAQAQTLLLQTLQPALDELLQTKTKSLP